MGTKTITVSGIYRDSHKIKKDPQTWGRKHPPSLPCNAGTGSKIKKDPQTWGRKHTHFRASTGTAL